MDRDVVVGSPPRHRLRLGLHVLDLDAGELRSPDGNLVPLRRQALEVLLMLGGRTGHLVDKASLMQGVWQTVVVGDDSLVQAVADIRRALGDIEHRLLRTVKRQGHMLVPTNGRVSLRAAAHLTPRRQLCPSPSCRLQSRKALSTPGVAPTVSSPT